MDSSIHVIHRTNRTLPTWLLQRVLRLLRGHILTPKPSSTIGSPSLSPPSAVTYTCHVIERNLADIYIYDVTSKTHFNDRKVLRRIYYVAGGSWQSPPGKQHWRSVARMASKLPNTVVSLVSVPLGPATPAPLAFPFLLNLYADLMRLSTKAGEEVIWAGDSSGANIAIALTLEALRLYPILEAPAAVVAICPSTDLTRENPRIMELTAVDPVLSSSSVRLSADSWAGDWVKTDPRLSPQFADLSPLVEKGVKVHGIIAGLDVLGPDAILFRELLQTAGVKGEWLQWEKQMHDFPLAWMYGFKESKEAFDWLLAVLSEV